MLQTDRRMDGGYNNIPIFSLKRAGIKNTQMVKKSLGKILKQ